MFLERLSRISDRIDGALALSLVARDGIPVESVSSDPATSTWRRWPRSWSPRRGPSPRTTASWRSGRCSSSPSPPSG